MNDKNRYTYYGLMVLSEFVFPELRKSEFEFPDVIVCRGKITDSTLAEDKSVGLHYLSENRFVFKLEPDLLFEVRDGVSIIVEASIDHLNDPGFFRSYLLSPVFNALLHQRGVSLFHASVVAGADSCYAIVGQSGDGKSTTAAFLCNSGEFTLVADDVCAVDFVSEGNYVILPSAPRIKLLKDTADKLGIPSDKLSESGDEDRKKSFARSSPGIESHISELGCIFILHPNNQNLFNAEEIFGIEKAQLLLNNMIWTEYLNYMGKRAKLFRECLKIAGSTQVYLLHFDKRDFTPEKVAALIKEKADQEIQPGGLQQNSGV